MEISEEIGTGQYRIKSCHNDGIIVNQKKYTHSFILMPNEVIHPWRPRKVDALEVEDWSVLLRFNLDVVLLGTGTQLIFPPPAKTAPLVIKQLGLEVMDNAACCRTYNILMAEERLVAAAILL